MFSKAILCQVAPAGAFISAKLTFLEISDMPILEKVCISLYFGFPFHLWKGTGKITSCNVFVTSCNVHVTSCNVHYKTLQRHYKTLKGITIQVSQVIYAPMSICLKLGLLSTSWLSQSARRLTWPWNMNYSFS